MATEKMVETVITAEGGEFNEGEVAKAIADAKDAAAVKGSNGGEPQLRIRGVKKRTC